MKPPSANCQTLIACPTGRCWTIGASHLMLLWCLVLAVGCFSSRAAFVYETASEFITSGDFDGDGRADVLVLDKLTGNARVGYQNANGALVWSAPRSTRADGASALAVGRFANTNREAIAVKIGRA